jgi:hypothetical protein
MSLWIATFLPKGTSVNSEVLCYLSKRLVKLSSAI